MNENISLIDHDGILLIVDVQSNFKKYFPTDPNGYLKKLDNYCLEFPSGTTGLEGVYQIWDSNSGSKPTYIFKNQKDFIEKKYGIKKFYSKLKGGFNEWIYQIFDEKTINQFNAKKNKFKEGDAFKLKNGTEFLIYIGNNHKWFLVNGELVELFKKLRNKKVIVVGGADNECLEDVYIALKSFNVIPVYNHQYIYSAKTGNYLKKVPKVNENEERTLGTKLSDEIGKKYLTMYRAVSNNQEYFVDKDYVTLSKKFAIEHAENNHIYNDEQQQVISAVVWSENLYNAYNPGEYFYSGVNKKGEIIYNTLGEDYEGYNEKYIIKKF
jgi:hypothetical protein